MIHKATTFSRMKQLAGLLTESKDDYTFDTSGTNYSSGHGAKNITKVEPNDLFSIRVTTEDGKTETYDFLYANGELKDNMFLFGTTIFYNSNRSKAVYAFGGEAYFNEDGLEYWEIPDEIVDGGVGGTLEGYAELIEDNPSGKVATSGNVINLLHDRKVNESDDFDFDTSSTPYGMSGQYYVFSAKWTGWQLRAGNTFRSSGEVPKNTLNKQGAIQKAISLCPRVSELDERFKNIALAVESTVYDPEEMDKYFHIESPVPCYFLYLSLYGGIFNDDLQASEVVLVPASSAITPELLYQLNKVLVTNIVVGVTGGEFTSNHYQTDQAAHQAIANIINSI